MFDYKRLLVLTTFLVASTASAGVIHEYEAGPGVFGHSGSLTDAQESFDSIVASYETGTDIFSWAVDYGDSPADGYWLVVSNGPNPKGDPGQLAIFYGDTGANTLFAYEYSGRNDSTSWDDPGNFLGDFSSDLSVNATGYSFSIDVTDLNSALVMGMGNSWEGAQFGELIGLWYHPTWGTASDEDSDGGLASFDYDVQGWYDREDEVTRTVPEPGTLALLGLGLAGVGFARRRRKV